MLDDPRINFAVSTRGKKPGLNHVGIQVESKDELRVVPAALNLDSSEYLSRSGN